MQVPDNSNSDKLTAGHLVANNSKPNNPSNPSKPNTNGYCATIGCNNGIGKRRAAYGHMICKGCGEEQSRLLRQSWTILQTYGKGGYQFVTPTAARAALHNTNQKQTRGELV